MNDKHLTDSPSAHGIFDDAQDLVYDEDDIQQLSIDPPTQDDHPYISLHALAGFSTPKTMRVKGFFKISFLQYSLIMVALITSLTPGSPNRLIVLSILAPALKSWFPMGEPYLAKGSVLMCVSLLEIITCTSTCFPCPQVDVNWFCALKSYTHLDPPYGIFLNRGCSFSLMEKNTH